MARRKRNEHTVNVNLQAFELPKAGAAILIEINDNNGRVGNLKIGKGSLQWRGGNDKKWMAIGWKRFAERMDKHGW